MNKTRIEWVRNPDGTPGYTWNPVTGCLGPNGTLCPWCYASHIATRFAGTPAFPHGFAPTWHPERLDEPLKLKKPSRIFVGSMTDMFGDWVTPQQLDAVLEVIAATPQHTYCMLTKQPQNIMAKLYEVTEAWPCRELGGNDYLPNLWLGVSVTRPRDRTLARKPLQAVIGSGWHTFYSIEPLLAWFPLCDEPVQWVIVGAQSGPGAAQHRPADEWVQAIISDCDQWHIPVFVKNSLSAVSTRQEWPQ